MSSDWKLGDIVMAWFADVLATVKIGEVSLHAAEGDPAYQVRATFRVLEYETEAHDTVIAGLMRFSGQGSAFRSTDSGKLWTETTHWSTAQNVTWKIVETSTGDLFACTGSQTLGQLGEIWRSQDEGVSWARVFQHPTRRNMTTLVEADNGDLLSACANGYANVGEFWRSQNGGAAWAKVGQTVNAGDVMAMAKANNNDLIAVMSRTVVAGAEVWRSQDNGATWAFVRNFSPSRYIYELICLSDGTLLAGGSSAGGGSAIWHSHDDGATWAILSAIPSGDTSFALFEDSDGTVHAGTQNGEMWHSYTKGASWLGGDLLDPSFPYIDCFVQLSNGDILAGTDAVGSTGLEVFRSQDSGLTWSYYSTVEGEVTGATRLYRLYTMAVVGQAVAEE